MIHTETRAINRTLVGLRNRKPLLLHQGGSSSGKTWGILYSLLQYLLHDRGKERLIWSVVAETLPHLKKGAIKDFRDILDATGLCDVVQENKTDHQFKLPNGSIIEFFSADNPTKVRGPRRDGLFINEANSIPWNVYYQLNLRTHETVILDWNPSGTFWLHDKLLPSLQESEYLFTRTTYHDNPSLGEKTRREIERLKDIDKQLYRIYAEGKTGQIQGLIFTSVTTCPEFPDDCKKVAFGLDFGFTNDPTALVKIGELHGELFGKELIYETGLTNNDIARRFEVLGLNKTDEIFADAAEPKSIVELKRLGWNVRAAPKGPDSVKFGIDILRQYRINLTAESKNWIKESNTYKWKEKDGESLNIPIDAFNHAWDAARYFAVSVLRTPKKRPKVTYY